MVMAAALMLVWLAWPGSRRGAASTAAPFVVMLGAGLILRGPYSFPDYPRVGLSAQERAVHFLEENLPPGSTVAVPVPLPALAARMADIELSGAPASSSGAGDLGHWLADNEVRAVYVDPSFIQDHPEIWQSIQGEVGVVLQRAFIGDPGSIQVFLVTAPPT
jgi:hypothetical protein